MLKRTVQALADEIIKLYYSKDDVNLINKDKIYLYLKLEKREMGDILQNINRDMKKQATQYDKTIQKYRKIDNEMGLMDNTQKHFYFQDNQDICKKLKFNKNIELKILQIDRDCINAKIHTIDKHLVQEKSNLRKNNHSYTKIKHISRFLSTNFVKNNYNNVIKNKQTALTKEFIELELEHLKQKLDFIKQEQEENNKIALSYYNNKATDYKIEDLQMNNLTILMFHLERKKLLESKKQDIESLIENSQTSLNDYNNLVQSQEKELNPNKTNLNLQTELSNPENLSNNNNINGVMMENTLDIKNDDCSFLPINCNNQEKNTSVIGATNVNNIENPSSKNPSSSNITTDLLQQQIKKLKKVNQENTRWK